jgi:hypothetical protein
MQNLKNTHNDDLHRAPFSIPTADPGQPTAISLPADGSLLLSANDDPVPDATAAATLVVDRNDGGKAGEGGALNVSNADFIATIMSGVPNGAFPAVCTKRGDPTTGGWRALPANQGNGRLRADHNNYLNCASFRPGTDGSFNARKERFAACHLFMLDDIGTKVAHEQLAGFEPTWLIETSPSNFQAGLVLDEPLLKAEEAVALLQALINAGLCDPGSAGAASRWARLPQGVNAKRKYLDESGRPFRCRLASWNPARRFTAAQIIERFKLTVAGPATLTKRSPTARVKDAQQVLVPGKEENPAITALKEGLNKCMLLA